MEVGLKFRRVSMKDPEIKKDNNKLKLVKA
jgi:hypothetical protein